MENISKSWLKKLTDDEIKYAKEYLIKHSKPFKYDNYDLESTVTLNPPSDLSLITVEIKSLEKSESGRLLITKLQTAVRQYRARASNKTKNIKISIESYNSLIDISSNRNQPLANTLDYLIINYKNALKDLKDTEVTLSKLRRAENKLSRLEKLNSEERLDKLMDLYKQQQMFLSAWEINYKTETPPSIPDHDRLKAHANKNIGKVKTLLELMKLRRNMKIERHH